MMNLATVEEACDLVTDGTHYTPKNVGAGIPFLTVKDVTDSQLDFVNCSLISDDDYRVASEGNSAPQKGDVLFSKDGTVGKVHVVGTETHFAVLSSLAILRPKRGLVDPVYLGHVLRSPKVLDEAQKRKTGSAIRRIILSDLKRVQIPLPALAEQRRIAGVLDKAEALRTKRRAALAQLDTLTQSMFVDMFGHPATNPKGLPRAKLGDVIFSASDGPHVSPVYVEKGIPFVSTRHVRAGDITWEDLKFISQEDAEIHWRKCKPERGDILYTKGGTTGLAALVTTDDPFAVWVHVALLKVNRKKADPKWLESMLNNLFCYRQSQDLTHGIANRDLGLTRMVNIKMYLPRLEDQREFSRRIAIVEKLKAAYRNSFTELNMLFAALQHRAFQGEL